MISQIDLCFSKARKADWTLFAFCWLLAILPAGKACSQEPPVRIGGEVLTELTADLIHCIHEQYSICIKRSDEMAVEGSPFLDILHKLEQKGIRLIICMTCLKYYDLEDKVKGGIVGGMNDIVFHRSAVDDLSHRLLEYKMRSTRIAIAQFKEDSKISHGAAGISGSQTHSLPRWGQEDYPLALSVNKSR
jgi:hypothetical protein